MVSVETYKQEVAVAVEFENFGGDSNSCVLPARLSRFEVKVQQGTCDVWSGVVVNGFVLLAADERHLVSVGEGAWMECGGGDPTEAWDTNVLWKKTNTLILNQTWPI